MADEDDLSDLLGPEPEPVAAPAPKPLTPGRDLQRRSRSLGLRPRKLSTERLIRICNALADMPVDSDACMLAGVSTSTLKYWLLKSKEGSTGDGFDVPVLGDSEEDDGTIRFHEMYMDAMEVGIGRVERAAITRGLGYLEPLTYQGRVIYKHDPDLVALFGYECMQTYLLDAEGKPVPETVLKQDPDLLQFILKTRKKDVYGNVQQIDVMHRGGVLVVAAPAPAAALSDQSVQNYKADAVDVEFVELGDPEARP